MRIDACEKDASKNVTNKRGFESILQKRRLSRLGIGPQCGNSDLDSLSFHTELK